jgi:hypothetical protein
MDSSDVESLDRRNDSIYKSVVWTTKTQNRETKLSRPGIRVAATYLTQIRKL